MSRISRVHVCSVQCVVSWGFRASRFQRMVCRVWSVLYVTFAMSNMSFAKCVQYVTFSVSIVRYPV